MVVRKARCLARRGLETRLSWRQDKRAHVTTDVAALQRLRPFIFTLTATITLQAACVHWPGAMALYKPGGSSSSVLPGRSEFEILKSSHK